MAQGAERPKRKTVIITGLFGPYLGELDEELGGPGEYELWNCNMGYTIQPGITRLHIFDPPEFWLPAEEKRNALFQDLNERDFPVYMQDVHPEVIRSVRFPAAELIEHFGLAYFTSTITWQLAQAIWEGYERIVLHKIHCSEACHEYFHQKSALDYWLGVAVGRGIELRISEDSFLCRPHSWHSPIYGYHQMVGGEVISHALGSVISQLLRATPSWVNNSPFTDELLAQAENLKGSGQVSYYKPTEKPRDECFLPSHLTEADKRSQNEFRLKLKKSRELAQAVHAKKEQA